MPIDARAVRFDSGFAPTRVTVTAGGPARVRVPGRRTPARLRVRGRAAAEIAPDSGASLAGVPKGSGGGYDGPLAYRMASKSSANFGNAPRTLSPNVVTGTSFALEIRERGAARVGLEHAGPWSTIAALNDPIAENRYRGVDWKQDLRFCRTELHRHLEIGGSVLVAVERFVMSAALAFRKLLEHQILSNEVRDARWPARQFPCDKPPDPRLWFDGTVDLVNYHHFVRHYDLNQPAQDRLQLKALSDRLLHSLVFVVWPRPEDTVPDDTRFFFNSDWRQQAVWEMTVGEYLAVVEAVLYDDVAWVNHNKYQKNPDRQEQHNSAWVARQRARGVL